MERRTFLQCLRPNLYQVEDDVWPPKREKTSSSSSSSSSSCCLPLQEVDRDNDESSSTSSSLPRTVVVSIEPVEGEPACFANRRNDDNGNGNGNGDDGNNQRGSGSLKRHRLELRNDPAMCAFDMAFVGCLPLGRNNGNGSHKTASSTTSSMHHQPGQPHMTSPCTSTTSASTRLSHSQQSKHSPASAIRANEVKVFFRFEEKYVFGVRLSSIRNAKIVPSSECNQSVPVSLVVRLDNCSFRMFFLDDLPPLNDREVKQAGKDCNDVSKQSLDTLSYAMRYFNIHILNASQTTTQATTPINKTTFLHNNISILESEHYSSQIYDAKKKDKVCANTKRKYETSLSNRYQSQVLVQASDHMTDRLAEYNVMMHENEVDIEAVLSLCASHTDFAGHEGVEKLSNTCEEVGILLTGIAIRNSSLQALHTDAMTAKTERKNVEEAYIEASQNIEGALDKLFPDPRVRVSKKAKVTEPNKDVINERARVASFIHSCVVSKAYSHLSKMIFNEN